MTSLLPVGVYGLEVPAGDVMVPSQINFPGTFRLTMAAIDPSAAPKHTGTANGDAPARATLKIIYEPVDPTEDSDDDSEEGYLQQLLQASQEESEDEESSSDEEEKNGGPSDPSKSKKARKQAAVDQMMKALAEENSEDEKDVDSATKTNGALSKVKKGKGKATEEDDESSEDEDEEGLNDLEELVLCTLDPAKNYQQPLDLTIGEDQRAYFKVSGTHTVYLTGNYVIPVGGGHDHQHGKEDDEDYDLSPDEEDLYDEDESDELDDIEDPRITEVGSEEDDPPKLTPKEEPAKEEPAKKGKNKRVAEESVDEPASLDDIMAKSLKAEEPTTNNEAKLSKKQRKKLKNNAGKGVETQTESADSKKDDQKAKGSPDQKGDKKVQFAKNLEQGPSTSNQDAKTESKKGSKADTKAEGKPDSKKESEKPKAGLGLKVVQGVSIDDKKLGKGPAVKNGDKVGMRYIGKLQDGKIFDANKKGSPFTFKLGAGQVIKGWDIGVLGMSVGGERRITVPAHLAYGSKAVPGIPANSQLTFDLKLLEIK